MKANAIEMIILQEQTGEVENAVNMQPATVPDLLVGTHISMLLNYGRYNATNVFHWRKGVVEVVSDVENISKDPQDFYG